MEDQNQRNGRRESPSESPYGSGLQAETGSSESITSRAYARLRSDIIDGILKPGRKLKIDELRKIYDVGTSPIREALSLLTSDNFVERIDQRGFRVAAISKEEFDELLKTRCWLEERALRESIEHGDADWEEAIVLAAYHLSRIPRSEASDHFVHNPEWESRHKQFHMTLISACGSSILRDICDQLYDQNIRYRKLSGPKAYPGRDVTAEHETIKTAALDRKADKAVEMLLAHYKRTGGFLTPEE